MGYRIYEARTEINMSQEELASKSGVSRTTICKLESGKMCTVTTSTLTKLAKALGKTVNEIFFE